MNNFDFDFDKFYEQFKDEPLTEAEVEKLRNSFNQIIENASKEFTRMKRLYGGLAEIIHHNLTENTAAEIVEAFRKMRDESKNN